MPDPKAPLNELEKAIFGHDAVRDPVTGEIFEQGLHSLPRDVQAAAFLQASKRTDDMSAEGERCAQTGREFECGSGALGKAAQSRNFLNDLPPADRARRATAAAALAAIEPAGKA
jgi:hypothetical protein